MQVKKSAQHGSLMNRIRSINKPTDNADSMCNIASGDRHIYKSTGKLTINNRVTKWLTTGMIKFLSKLH